jgi:hypothetical protein
MTLHDLCVNLCYFCIVNVWNVRFPGQRLFKSGDFRYEEYKLIREVDNKYEYNSNILLDEFHKEFLLFFT